MREKNLSILEGPTGTFPATKTSSLSSHGVVNRRWNMVTDRDTCHKMLMKLERRGKRRGGKRKRKEGQIGESIGSLGNLMHKNVDACSRTDRD